MMKLLPLSMLLALGACAGDKDGSEPGRTDSADTDTDVLLEPGP